MANSRVVFTFDENSLESLVQVQKRSNLSSMGAAVRESVQLSEILQDQVAEGFAEVVLRNPKTNQEKILISPFLRRAASSAKRGAGDANKE